MRLPFEIIAFLFFWEVVFSESLFNLGTSKNSSDRDAEGLKIGGSLFDIKKDSLFDWEESVRPEEQRGPTHESSHGNSPDQSSGSLLGGNQQYSSERPSTNILNRPGQGSDQVYLGESSSFTSSKDRDTLLNKPNLENNSTFGLPNKENVDTTEKDISSQPNHGGSHSNVKPAEPHDGIVIEQSVQEPEKEKEKEICFPAVGCFSLEAPWKTALRPIGKPFAPEVVQTTLHFYSRENLKNQKNITLHPKIVMGEAKFDPEKITAVVVHGFGSSGNATWMKKMKDAYLKQVDANVFIVDWGRGAQNVNYFEACGNTRLVGKQLAIFVEHLKQNYGANTKKFHLIGHSLGAQISSYLAKDVRGIARLTALDPAQPYFEGFDARIRLDKSDADFVDVIHTDAKPIVPTFGFGMMAPHGHVDFYVNGGFDQPGCIPLPKKDIPINSVLDLAKYPVEVISKLVSCPHSRAYEILIESFNDINNCIFWGHKADVTNVFKSISNTLSQGLFRKILALSTTCSTKDCIPLGFATRKSSLRGLFVVTTNARAPYCISEPGIPPEDAPPGKVELSSNQNNTTIHERGIRKLVKQTLG